MGFPQTFGMEKIDAGLYVEPAMTTEQRLALRQQLDLGRAAVRRFYGELSAEPCVVACISEACDLRFGSYGQRAAAYGDMAIRLSPRGQAAAVIAHEWSHAEIYFRVGGWWRARRLPRWFDEGVAVVVADEPRHSEDNWRQIQRLRLPTPPLAELVSFADWGRAMSQYGETAGDGPGNRHVVYSAAGHEVRAFMSCAGRDGLARLLADVRAGTAFVAAYAAATARCMPR